MVLEPFISTATRYTRPVPLADRLLNPTKKDDIFAFGSVLYEICVGCRLYAETNNGEVYITTGYFKDENSDTTGLI